MTFEIAARMDPKTGQVDPLNAAQLEAERRAGRERILAWALGAAERGGRARGTTSSRPVAPTQEALFT